MKQYLIYDKDSGQDITTVEGTYPCSETGLQVWEQDGTFGLCDICDESRAMIDEYLECEDWDLRVVEVIDA